VSVRWLRIAILMQQPVAPYYVHLKQGFEVAQKTFESQRVICAVTYFESLDASRVAQTIRHATQKADALIIVAYEHPDITAALRHASHAMPVITLASDLPGTGRLAYVGIDNRCAGRVAGELMGRFIGDAGGKVLVMTGMHDFLGHEERESGFRSVLRRRFPGCDIVETVESREQSALTERLTRDAFRRYPDLRGIYNISVGDEGIAAALRALDRVRSTVLIGHELNESSRRLLIEGALDAVLDQNLDRDRAAPLPSRPGHRAAAADSRHGAPARKPSAYGLSARLMHVGPPGHAGSAATSGFSLTSRSASSAGSITARRAMSACAMRTSRAISPTAPTPLAPTIAPSRSSAKKMRERSPASRTTVSTPNAGMPAIWIAMSY
jgi:LacI family transcriptional regulator